MQISNQYSFALDQTAATKRSNTSAPTSTQFTIPQQPAVTTSSTNQTVSATAATEKTPAQQLKDYLAMSDAERFQMAWLKNRGMSKEEFDALPPEEKQKLMEEMQEDMRKQQEEKMRASMEKQQRTIDIQA
jgi:predicted flavoprotein YhiN